MFFKQGFEPLIAALRFLLLADGLQSGFPGVGLLTQQEGPLLVQGIDPRGGLEGLHGGAGLFQLLARVLELAPA